MMASRSRRICLLVLAVAAGAALQPAGGASAQDQPVQPGFGEVLKIPGIPDIPMPPGMRLYGPHPSQGADSGGDEDRPDGGMVVGPGGVIPPSPAPSRHATAPKSPPTPAERDAAIRKALVPHPPLAVAQRRTLDDLYAKLATSSDTDEAKGLAGLIGGVWMRSGSDTSNLLMTRAMVSLQAKDLGVAAELLDKLIVLDPGWAEAWNKRATVRFMKGDLDGSMADVEHVLKLEPKHFGALEGMAMILQRTGFDKQALEIYRRALVIYPHQPDVQQVVDKLSLRVEGQGI